MFDNDNTLNLLDKYRKSKYKEKENGQFKTKKQNNSNIPNFVWITITIFIGYFIITNLMNRLEKQRLTRKIEAVNEEIKQENKAIKEITKTSFPIIQNTPKVTQKYIEITPYKPIETVQKSTPKIEQTKENVTIKLAPNNYTQKQTTVKKVEEEIHPSSSTSVGYYR